MFGFFKGGGGTCKEDGDKNDDKKGSKNLSKDTTSRSKSLDHKTIKQPVGGDKDLTPLEHYVDAEKIDESENYLDTNNGQLFHEAGKAFDKIVLQYSNFHKKFSDIKQESKPEVYLELIEELNQLIFSLDRVEVGSVKQLKDERRDIIKTVQALIKQAQNKTQNNTGTHEIREDNGSEEDIFEDFLKFGNNMHQNVVCDPQPINHTGKTKVLGKSSVGHHDERSKIGQPSGSVKQPGIKKSVNVQPSQKKKNISTGRNPIILETKNPCMNKEHNSAGVSSIGPVMNFNIGYPMAGDHIMGIRGAVAESPNPEIQQADAENGNDESMDFEILDNDLQNYQDAVSDLPAAVNNMMILHEDNVMSVVHHKHGRGQLNANGQPKHLVPVAPIQLLVRNVDGMFELDEAAIKSVLCGDKVKNRKIAIVSVVGAFRRGKSFLLNFMLRYLRAQGHSDWLIQSDLVEGFSWCGGRERDTTGIMMWPEAFLVGEDLALILLDTQGTFDKKTPMKENTFIFALSTLLSSVQIYNLHERIQLDDLANLQYFMEFGRMVQSECNNKVFEKFIFLIRDWKFGDEVGYGFDGGNNELGDWFSMEHNTEQAEMIQTCFKQVLCFLMPHPGDQVSRNINFRGALKDIEPDFLDQLKIFIETVLHPDKLAVKQIGGQCVSAQDLLAYMKNYVEKLQHPDLEPKTLFQSMSDTCHEKVMGKAKHVYMTQMEAGLRDITVDIQALHQTAQQSACQYFDNAPKFGSNYYTKSYRKKLLECLEELYIRYAYEYELHNEARFYAACSDIYEAYQTSLTAFCMQLQHECTLEEKCKEACKHVTDSLTKLKFNVPQDRRNNKMLEMQKKMKQFYEQQIPYFKARQEHMQASKTKEHYTEVKQKVVKCYQQIMDNHCGGPDPVDDFDAVHSRAEYNAHKLMYADIEYYHLSDCNEMHKEINKEIYDICKRYKAHDKRKIEKKKEDAFKLLMVECRQAVIDKYRHAMEDKCGGLKTVENIEEIHKAANIEAISLFYNHSKMYGEICHPFINNAKESMNDLFVQYKFYNEEKQKHNAKERAIQLRSAAIHYYDEQMDVLQIGTKPVQNFEGEHERITEDCIKVLDPIVASQFYTSTLQSLKERVAQRMEYFKQINNAKLQQTALLNIKTKLDESIQCYQEKMDNLHIDTRPVDDLDDSHTLFKNQAKNILQELSEMEGYDKVINQFEKEVEKKWKGYKEKNKQMHKLFKNDEKRTVMESYNSMKTEYTSAMQREMSAAVSTKNSSLLFKEHQKQRDICIANFQEFTRDCGEDYKAEFLAKLKQDIKTSYEDIEETYAKNMRDLRVKEEQLRRGASKTYTIGIDLGTTNCCAAVYRNGKVEIIINSIDKTTTPSVVCFKDHETVFGETAVKSGVTFPENCISEMKRIIGRRYNDPVVQARMQKWHFKVVNVGGTPAVKVTKGRKSSYKPEEISALVLGEMKRIAEVYLGSKVHDAVVTIPAYFNELQREATKAACVQAGLNVLRMINEPTAAAIAFGLQCKSNQMRTVLVFDFGGGTCDISIMTIQGKTFTVKASKGDNVLGGEDFDDRLTDHVTRILERMHRININSSGRRRLRIACEMTKRKLSEQREYNLQMEEFIYDGINRIDFNIIIHKREFEFMTKDLVQQTLVPVKQCLREANMRPEDIDEVVMVGGSSKMPKIQELLKNFFRRRYLNMRIDPDEAIAYGAAIQAAVSCGELKDYNINEITPISLGASMVHNRMGIITPKNSRIPCSHTDRRVTVEDYQTSMFFTLYQGECEEDEFQNTRIGEFTIRGIRSAPAGQTKADVTFTIDADGILHVSAVEVGNHRNKVQLTVEKKVL